MRIKITVGDVKLKALLRDNQTAKTIYDALPIEGSVQTWGDEIYFGIPIQMDLEEAQEVVKIGDLAYWPPGHAFCIFYGQTPASGAGGLPRAASEVTVFGRIEDNTEPLKNVKAKTIKVEKVLE
jgi:hypothetical protein